MIDRFEKFSFGIFEISRNWNKLASVELEKLGLKGPHALYLMTMLKYPQGITAPKLCELCGKNKSDVSRMMSIMEEKGIVVKESVYQNRYGGVFTLTEKGKAAATQLEKRVALAVELAGKDLSDEKRTAFYEALESISENLRILSRDGIPETEEKSDLV